MIGSIAVLSTLVAAPSATVEVRPPRVDKPEVRVEVPPADVNLPHLQFRELPRLDFPDVEFPESRFDGFAMASRDDEDEADEDRDQADEDARRNERDRLRERYRDEMRWRDDSGYSFTGPPTAKAAGKGGSASLAVKGPVTLRLRVLDGEGEVVASDKSQVQVTVSGTAKDDLQLLQYGDRVEVEFGGRTQLRHGHVRVELPKGSSVDFVSTSGDITVRDVGGDVRARTMSGDVKIAGARTADVNAISGDVHVSVTGPRLRLHVVSGNVVAATSDPGLQLDFESASGALDWTGVCAKGCRLNVQTVSGDIKLQPDASKSSFELSYASHSGDLRDELNLNVKRSPKRKHGAMSGWLEAVYGKGEGVIECDAFSGDLIVKKK
jgi:hypothetical protein